MIIKHRRILFGKNNMILYLNKNRQILILHLKENILLPNVNFSCLNGNQLATVYHELIDKHKLPILDLVDFNKTIIIEEKSPYNFTKTILKCLENGSRIFSYDGYIYDLSECTDEVINKKEVMKK